jgi:phosphoglycolate phosphatase
MRKDDRWIFFDIDGTLLYARGAGRKAFRQAFKEALNWDQGVEHINFYGATDLDVFRRIAADRGETSTPQMEKAFFERLGACLSEHLAHTPPELFPNIGKIVPDLSATALPHSASRFSDHGSSDEFEKGRHPGSSGWKLGVVTGNIEATAKAKLKSAGLLQYFDPSGFGCGCDHPDRVEIARIALHRAGNPQTTVLIGDTPRDVEAAKANGMVSIAVATGIFDIQALEKAGADHVFEDLTDSNRLFSILKELETSVPAGNRPANVFLT